MQNLETLFQLEEVPDGASPEDDRKAKRIAELVKSSHDGCFGYLNKTYQELCVNLDVQKRLNLSAATLYCEHLSDKREDKLPYLDPDPHKRNYTKFIAELEPETFSLFTAMFINIDSICFHATSEAQSTANMRTMNNIWVASSLATAHINQSRHKLENITNEVVGKLDGVHKQMNETGNKILDFQGRVTKIVDQVKSLTDKAKNYENSVVKFKLYLLGLAVGFVVNLIVPNTFVPTVAVTGLFLIAETFLFPRRRQKVRIPLQFSHAVRYGR